MIFGIGTDILHVERIQKVYDRHGERFVNHLLMPAELSLLESKPRIVRFLAMRFAAKEAIVKALGTGFANGMWLRDTGIVANAWGRPEVIWSKRGQDLCDKLGIGDTHVTLSDEAGLVVAVAVLMRK
jgi:holo-[acyl-carrier protein] synthase